MNKSWGGFLINLLRGCIHNYNVNMVLNSNWRETKKVGRMCSVKSPSWSIELVYRLNIMEKNGDCCLLDSAETLSFAAHDVNNY